MSSTIVGSASLALALSLLLGGCANDFRAASDELTAAGAISNVTGTEPTGMERSGGDTQIYLVKGAHVSDAVTDIERVADAHGDFALTGAIHTSDGSYYGFWWSDVRNSRDEFEAGVQKWAEQAKTGVVRVNEDLLGG